MAATPLYANRGLTYTPCLAYSAATTLRAGGGTRNALLQRQFWSAIACNSFCVGPGVASGIKCKYNCARISRLYLASKFRTNPPAPNRSSLRPSATQNFGAPECTFAPALKRLLFSTSDDVHLLTKILNRRTQATRARALSYVPTRILSRKYNMRCESAIVAIPS